MTGQMGLPGVAEEFGARDPLGRRYTPDKLALACLRRVLLDPPEGTWVVDGHVGGGAWVRMARELWPGIKVLGVDVDPGAPGLAICDEAVIGDWAELAADLVPKFRWPRVVGNPPFDDPRGGDPDRAQRHLKATCAAFQGRGWVGGWVLPLAYLGTAAWGTLLRRFPPQVVAPVSGRPWGEFVRETAFYQSFHTDDHALQRPEHRRANDGWHVRLGKPIEDWQ